MRKATRMHSLRGLRASGIGALSLAVVLAAGGCSTNKMPGNGTPSNPTNLGPAGTASTPGTSSGTEGTVKPPMISSSPGDAAATIAAAQPHTPRVLGPADPSATVTQNAPAPPTGQYQNPALAVNPQDVGVIASTGSALTTGATTSAVTGAVTNSVTAASTAAPATAGTSNAMPPNSTVTNTGATSIASPTVASVGATQPLVSTSGSTATTTPTTAIAGTTATTASSAPVHVVTTSDGVVVTNANARQMSVFQRVLRAMHLTGEAGTSTTTTTPTAVQQQ